MMPAMKKQGCRLSAKMLVILLISLPSMVNIPRATSEVCKFETYIVFVRKPEQVPSSEIEDLDNWYKSFLPVTISGTDEERMVYSYRNVVTGFAAKLTAEEAKAMEKKEGFLFARPERSLPLHTTHTPSFLGLQESSGLWKNSNYGKGVIIGLLDTGISPDHPSFSDEGMPPPPKKWKGSCELNGTTCNKKLIGARNFLLPDEPALDHHGHGTHTASTAAGSPVKFANFYGELNGTASGIAPLAHVAMYKTCNNHCKDSAIVAAMDAAVEDGVDVLSLSLGGRSHPFSNDVIAIGAYGATQKGVFVSCSAGNSGPKNHSLSNEAPWILTVGASTVDREIRATVLLGNKKIVDGQSLTQPKDFPTTPLPLVNPAARLNSYYGLCLPGSLRNLNVTGKIVLCQGGGVQAPTDMAKGQEVKDSGGAAMILMNYFRSGYVTRAEAHVLPASYVSYEAGLAIQAYINSTSSPEASIVFKRTVYGLPEAPQVASFSSRGPSLASPGILKPDVIGPGVNILAAWPISVDHSTNSPATFNVMSGTSMACPHLSGIAALLKSTHPEWSPAAIKSAIMTTTDIHNLGGKPISDQRNVQQLVPASVFAMGAGHVNASRVNDPGLIYDLQPDDYIPYLCGLNYSDEKVGLIVQRSVNCSNYNSTTEAQLNYPSFSIILGSSPQTYTRTVTNVGEPNSSYNLGIIAPQGVDVKVTPNVITFTEVNQKATYLVTFSKNGKMTGGFAQGYLIWKFNSLMVRSPIAVIH